MWWNEKSRKWLCMSHLVKTFLYYGSEHTNGDDGCNDESVYNVYLLRFLYDNESNRVNLQE